MSLRKLTASGDVQVLQQWARPAVYETWLAQLAPADYEAILEALHAEVANREVVRAQWLVCRPGQGSDWKDVYVPVWEAMGHDEKFAGQFIGLILWEVMQQRPEDWYFHKVDKTIINEYNLLEDIQVAEYFKCDSYWSRNAGSGQTPANLG